MKTPLSREEYEALPVDPIVQAPGYEWPFAPLTEHPSGTTCEADHWPVTDFRTSCAWGELIAHRCIDGHGIGGIHWYRPAPAPSNFTVKERMDAAGPTFRRLPRIADWVHFDMPSLRCLPALVVAVGKEDAFGRTPFPGFRLDLVVEGETRRFTRSVPWRLGWHWPEECTR
jgi:hypothetical protein